MKFRYSTLFFIRNIKRNADVRLNGIFSLTKSKMSKFYYNAVYIYFCMLYFLRYRLGKLDIPQIEIFLTTDCNLNCQHCENYIPLITENRTYQFEDFKKDLDAFLKNVDSVQYLTFSGGEPLLLENIEDFIDYAASKRKIKNVIVMTNGTIILNNKIINSVKKHCHKVSLYISDYSRSKDIDATLLRTRKLINLCKRNKIRYYFDENLKWHITVGCRKNNRKNEQLRMLYAKCINPNLSCFDGKINPCSRATAVNLLDVCQIPEDQYLDLRKDDLSKSKIIEWYSTIKPFAVCDFCNQHDIEKMQPEIIPGAQINNDNLYW